ncbi:hypothetical protein AMECASPLE_025438 [Ameca splendens]|uniref:Uncharacterized protein n=1 Tax=Ameca splendens TaxID=208324 RepID=A0ABV0Z496_9TELE
MLWGEAKLVRVYMDETKYWTNQEGNLLEASEDLRQGWRFTIQQNNDNKPSNGALVERFRSKPPTQDRRCCKEFIQGTEDNYRGWTMKLKHLVLDHNNLLVWCRASFCGQYSVNSSWE